MVALSTLEYGEQRALEYAMEASMLPCSLTSTELFSWGPPILHIIIFLIPCCPQRPDAQGVTKQRVGGTHSLDETIKCLKIYFQTYAVNGATRRI